MPIVTYRFVGGRVRRTGAPVRSAITPVPTGFDIAWDVNPDATGYVVGWDSVPHTIANGADDDGDPNDMGLYAHTQDVGNVTSATISSGPGTWYAAVHPYDAVEPGQWDLVHELVKVV